jgi:hypothetical protein
VVDRWIEAARGPAIRSIICLLADEHLKRYDSIPGGLLGRYIAAGFEVAHIPVLDHRVPTMSDDELKAAWAAFRRLPGPALVHCSAGIESDGGGGRVHPQGGRYRPGRSPAALVLLPGLRVAVHAPVVDPAELTAVW